VTVTDADAFVIEAELVLHEGLTRLQSEQP
jgi:hypothetical protein